jgi:hypothetical protein
MSKRDKTRSRARAGITFAAVLLALSARAQAPPAVLSGTVSDPAGKPVAAATVSARNIATSETVQARTDASGRYQSLSLPAGEYEISVAAPGFSTTLTRMIVTAGGAQTIDLTLRGLSLEDLGFPLAQAKGSAADQALLDKRSHMLKLHQRYGLIAAIPMIATVATGGLASGKETSSSGRNLHAALGITTATLYSISAYYALAAPKIPGTETRGNTKWHKALGWVHGAGMVATPILGAMAYSQRKNGEKVHGAASAHGAVAVTMVISYAAAILTETLK